MKKEDLLRAISYLLAAEDLNMGLGGCGCCGSPYLYVGNKTIAENIGLEVSLKAVKLVIEEATQERIDDLLSGKVTFKELCIYDENTITAKEEEECGVCCDIIGMGDECKEIEYINPRTALRLCEIVCAGHSKEVIAEELFK